MRSYGQIRNELSHQLREDMPRYFIDGEQMNAETVAEWILMNYKPPMDWEANPIDLNRTMHSLRMLVAGRFFKYASIITDEQARRSSRVVDEIKRRIRWAIGHNVVDWLSGMEVSEVEEI